MGRRATDSLRVYSVINQELGRRDHRDSDQMKNVLDVLQYVMTVSRLLECLVAS